MAIQPPFAPLPPSKGQPKKARWSTLNMGIAKTHRIATQFVGIQLSGANLLALMVSALSVVAGTVTLVAQKYPYNWPLLLSAGVIGLGLAFLIEGLTLGSLIRIRLANRAIRRIEEKIDDERSTALAALLMPDLAQPHARQAMHHYRRTLRLLRQDFRRKRQQATSLQRKQRRFSLPFATMGAISSATAGGLFYHTILTGLGPVESLVLAVLFPLVVTGTFVSSEIQKDAQEDAIKEGFAGGALTETAIREETKLHSALAVHQKVMAYLEKPEAEQAMEEGAKHLLSDILAELRETSRQMTQRVMITEENTDDTTRQLPLGKQTGNTTSSHAKEVDNATSVGLTTASDMTSSGSEELNDLAFLSKKEANDTTSSGLKEADNTTQPSSPIVSLVQETPKTSSNTTHHDSQEHAIRPQRLEDDTTHALDTPQKNQEEKRQHDLLGQRDAVSHDTPGNRTRQPFPLSSQGGRPEATPEYDALTTHILAYLAEHDHARQVDVAQALGITVRTVQRKLTALKQQQADP